MPTFKIKVKEVPFLAGSTETSRAITIPDVQYNLLAPDQKVMLRVIAEMLGYEVIPP